MPSNFFIVQLTIKTIKVMQNGIEYKITGQRERGEVAGYHRKPQPLFLNKSKYGVDVSGLKKVDQKAIKFDGIEFASKYTIGFEVEKNQLSRNAVREYELFCGFERDGSCGYEAVTHVLPLLPAGQWRTKVYDMMHKAEKIIDDRFSPSDRRCGGHITIAVDGIDGAELLRQVRKNAGIVLALFRHRLTNRFCGDNRRMETDFYGDRYQVALVKGVCLEFRLPSRFESVKQMMRRYELMFHLVDFSIQNPNGSFDTFMKRVQPVILSMYNGDADKANKVMTLAKHFQKYINTGEVSDSIREYLTR
jgi:hypothetical protein